MDESSGDDLSEQIDLMIEANSNVVFRRDNDDDDGGSNVAEALKRASDEAERVYEMIRAACRRHDNRHDDDHMVALLRGENARLTRMLDRSVEAAAGSRDEEEVGNRARRIRTRLLRVERFLARHQLSRATLRLACDKLRAR